MYKRKYIAFLEGEKITVFSSVEGNIGRTQTFGLPYGRARRGRAGKCSGAVERLEIWQPQWGSWLGLGQRYLLNCGSGLNKETFFSQLTIF